MHLINKTIGFWEVGDIFKTDDSVAPPWNIKIIFQTRRLDNQINTLNYSDKIEKTLREESFGKDSKAETSIGTNDKP
ncbi:hypothetical protein CEXT_284331 [Caerostris extrusa]|uniref:Uncharacterized protein n=1 Tax=Caerostris extrusa TaxID=172846 RepID=A0AAV4Q2E8_CAEEX|nr:hypothetical protein CEXT_284331 [Caerostris extrusa]